MLSFSFLSFLFFALGRAHPSDGGGERGRSEDGEKGGEGSVLLSSHSIFAYSEAGRGGRKTSDEAVFFSVK